jgi:formamidase
MPEVIFEVNRDLENVLGADQPRPLHNRWHPDIPPATAVDPGHAYRIECKDWTDEQIRNTDSADDVRDVNLDKCHMLSGPIAINGAEPGDILVVDVLEMGPFPHHEWGYTGIFAKENGGGFLTDYFPEANKAIWDFQGVYTTSRHLPGLRFAGNRHPGLFGCAPSRELLDDWNRREGALLEQNPDRVTGDQAAQPGDVSGTSQVPPLALPPLEKDCLLGTLSGGDLQRAATEAVRTVPPRDHGGNVDIKDMGIGSRTFLPVYVPGALFSIGDLHFAQGDGEITFCGAIEFPGYIDLGFHLIKGGVDRYALNRANKWGQPVFKPGNVAPNFSEYLVFEGISVEDDRQYYMNATVSYRRACMNAIEYLSNALGWSREQCYLMLGAAPIEGRIGGIVDIPNCSATVAVPLAMFDRDILPAID